MRCRMKNGSGKGAANGSAATTFPDILNGGGNGKLPFRLLCHQIKGFTSATRLGDFLKFLATNLLQKSSQNIWKTVRDF